MPSANQLRAPNTGYTPSADELLAHPVGVCSMAGLVRNIDVNLAYMSAWLAGTGCVPYDNQMEDAATAEISRVQLWQWRRHRVSLDCGQVVDDALLMRLVRERVDLMRATLAKVSV